MATKAVFTRAELLEHEKEATLKRFTVEDGYKLGEKVVQTAGEKADDISIAIYSGQRLLFFRAGKNTTYENQFWAERKRNVVKQHEHSSLFVRVDFDADEEEYYRLTGLSRVDYAIHGGGFPIRTEDAGFVGTLAVSGLVMEEDHLVCVRALKALRAEQSV